MESIDELKEKLYQEKLQRSGSRLAFRLVSVVIIFVIIFIVLNKEIGNANSIVQWICLILFTAIFLAILAGIAKRYGHEQDEAIRVKQPNYRRK
jgi:cytochrome bd-type quinol oxidase subunit 2